MLFLKKGQYKDIIGLLNCDKFFYPRNNFQILKINVGFLDTC